MLGEPGTPQLPGKSVEKFEGSEDLRREEIESNILEIVSAALRILDNVQA